MEGENFVSLEATMQLILRNRDEFGKSSDKKFDELFIALKTFPCLLKFATEAKDLY